MVVVAFVVAAFAVLALGVGLMSLLRGRHRRRSPERSGSAISATTAEADGLRDQVARLRAGEREAAWAVSAAAHRRVALTTRLDEAGRRARQAEERAAGMETRIAALTEAVAAASARSSPGSDTADRRLEDRLIAREAAIEDLRERLDGVSRARQAEVRRLRARIDDLERLHVEIDRRDREIERLDEAVKEAEEARRRAEDELQRIDRAGLRAAGATTRHQLGALKDALRSERERNARLVRRTSLGGPDRPGRDHAEVGRLTARIAELEAASTPDPVDPEDVTAVKGIGPRIAEILSGLGITSLRQIARLTDPDLDRIGEHLPVYGDRARDDRWVDQARGLLGMDADG